MANPTIWIIGKNGMLGQSLSHVLGHQTEFKPSAIITSDSEVDITKPEQVESFCNEHNMQSLQNLWIVNCAAYTAVDKAEEEEEKATQINAEGVSVLAKQAGKLGAKFIHISTDYVFDGTKDRPYVETDKVNPQSAYGRTKLGGEEELRRLLSAHYIIRTSWLYGPYGKNFVFTMLRLLAERDTLGIVSDQHGGPTYSIDLALFICKVISSSPEYGIYHFANSGQTTWHAFTKAILEQGKKAGLIPNTSEPTLDKVTTADYGAPAPRPANSVFDLTKSKKIMPMIPEWPNALGRCLDFIREARNE